MTTVHPLPALLVPIARVAPGQVKPQTAPNSFAELLDDPSMIRPGGEQSGAGQTAVPSVDPRGDGKMEEPATELLTSDRDFKDEVVACQSVLEAGNLASPVRSDEGIRSQADPFAALGMFGHGHGITFGGSALAASAGWTSRVSEALAALERQEISPWENNFAHVPDEGFEIPGADRDAALPLARPALHSVRAVGGPDTAEPRWGAGRSPITDPEGRLEATSRRPAVMRPNPYRESRADGPFLAVSGDAEALRILVAAQDLQAPEREQLRRLIESTTAEFGMSVDELLVNGAPSEHPFKHHVGGTDGDRAS
jgi:hypothetical protein